MSDEVIEEKKVLTLAELLGQALEFMKMINDILADPSNLYHPKVGNTGAYRQQIAALTSSLEHLVKGVK